MRTLKYSISSCCVASVYPVAQRAEQHRIHKHWNMDFFPCCVASVYPVAQRAEQHRIHKHRNMDFFPCCVASSCHKQTDRIHGYWNNMIALHSVVLPTFTTSKQLEYMDTEMILYSFFFCCVANVYHKQTVTMHGHGNHTIAFHSVVLPTFTTSRQLEHMDMEVIL